MGSFTMKPWKTNKKEKNMQNIKQRLKYFGIESYSQNWQTADSHEKAGADEKKNIIFIFIFPIYLHV